MTAKDSQYIRSISADYIRCASVGVDGSSVPNIDWVQNSFVPQNSIGASVNSQFSNKSILDGINQPLSVTSSPNFKSVTVDDLPASSNSLCARAYVDSAIAAVSPGPGT